MADRRLKAAVGVRGDCLYCPLPLYVDSYWNCEADCHHCYFRRLNRTWGQDLRPADPDEVRRKLENGLKAKSPKTSLAWALKLKKTIRVGNKTDPYQPVEKEMRVTRRILEHLGALRWSYVVGTRFPTSLARDEDVLAVGHKTDGLTVMPILSPGAERDWEVLERKRTDPIPERLKLIKRWIKKGWNVGVNGEPFIPGFHTEAEFRDTIRRLKEVGVRSYNTYNLHFNDHVAKRFVDIDLDIERIWRMNQDRYWRPILRRLCAIADEEGMRLGCPDFVNVAAGWKEKANTCCGVTVPNPSRFNAHFFRRDLQRGDDPEAVLKKRWEGIGDREAGGKIVRGEPGDFYTMKDADL